MQPSMVKAMEAITAVMPKQDGILYRDLLAKVEMLTGYSEATIARAAGALKEDGAIRSESAGRSVRYFMVDPDVPLRDATERALPIRRLVINAADAPRINGVRRNPMEWTLQTLSLDL